MFVDIARYHKLISQGSSVGGTVGESVKARTDVSQVRVLSLTTKIKIMKISYLICSLLIVLAISHSFSLHPVLASLISFGVGIGYMKTKDK